MNEQLRRYRQVEKRSNDMLRAFVEIQQGHNPMTPEEIRRLIDRYPGRYGLLEACAAPKEVK